MPQLHAAGDLLCAGRVGPGLEALRHALRDSAWPLPERRVLPATMALAPKLWSSLGAVTFRAESALAAADLARVDACYSAALALNNDAEGLALYLAGRQLLESLRLGEPLRIVRAAQLIAAMADADGGALTRRVATRLLDVSERAEQHVRDPRVAFWKSFRRMWQAYSSFDAPGLAEHWRASDQLGSSFGFRGLDRERVLLDVIGCFLAFQAGDVAAFVSRVEAFKAGARARGDEYALPFGELLDLRYLLHGEFAARITVLDQLLETERESSRGPRPSWVSDCELQAARFERSDGKPAAAWRRCQRVHAQLRGAPAWKVARIRAELAHEEAACALSLVAHDSASRGYWARAEAALADSPAPAEWQLAHRAGLAWLAGDQRGTLRHLEQAAEQQQVLGFWVSSCARALHGLIAGGERGQALALEASNALITAGAREPMALIRFYLPGIVVAQRA